MMSALQVETDSQNTHMLLGGLLLCVQDSVTFEEFDSGSSDVQSTSARETNLLSSGETMSIETSSIFISSEESFHDFYFNIC